MLVADAAGPAYAPAYALACVLVDAVAGPDAAAEPDDVTACELDAAGPVDAFGLPADACGQPGDAFAQLAGYAAAPDVGFVPAADAFGLLAGCAAGPDDSAEPTVDAVELAEAAGHASAEHGAPYGPDWRAAER